MFSTRTRPCLQYQIKRCTAPCVGRIDKAEYDAIVDEVRGFLGGRNREVQQALSQRMEKASADLEFERAAVLRDRIRALTHIQSHQSITLPSIDEADIFAAHAEGGQVCVQVFFLRAGQNLGNRAYFPSHARELDEPAVLSAFIGQFYEARPAPKLILTSHDVAERELLESALAMTAGPQGRDPPSQARRPEGRARPGRRSMPARRWRGAWPSAARSASCSRAWRACSASTAPPERIEIYDNSHIQGSAPIGAMIVAGPGRLHQECLSQVQHQDRGRGGRRLRHDARGADAPLRPRAARRIPNATRSTGPTWC